MILVHNIIKRQLFKIYNIFFKKIVRRVILEEMDYNATTIMATKIAIQRAFHYTSVNKVDGDFFEFGLYKGRSFIYALEECRKKNKRYSQKNINKKIHCHGFDSFQGLPKITSNKEDSFKDSAGKRVTMLVRNPILKKY